MAFFLKAIGLSDDIPGFPFTPAADDPGHVVYTSPLMCWVVRAGTPHDNAHKRVSIFTCTVPSSSSSSSHNNELVKQMCRNALRRAKSVMIPGFLKCFGAAEYRDTIYIATEACVSLKEVLESRELRTRLYGTAPAEYDACVAFGLNTIGEALNSLHQNRLVHGNVNCQSVFVLPSSGVWRLFGLELVSSSEEVVNGNSSVSVFDNARRAGVLEGYRCPPELSSAASSSASSNNNNNNNGSGGSDGGANADVFAIDSWGMAALLYESVGVTAEEAFDGKLSSIMHTLSSAELRNACRQRLPKSLHSGCAGITAANPRLRKSVQTFLEHCEFVKDCAFVQYMKRLSEALLLDVAQQVRLVESLNEVVDTFPLRPCLCCVLPQLSELIRAAMKLHNPNGAAGVSIGPVVSPVLKIATRTNAGDDFDAYVTPVLVQMFQCSDVLMRYNLLLGAEVYGGKVSPATLNNTIWPLYAKGFQYAMPNVREYSARGLVHLAPHLSEAVLGDQVPRALGLLQRDQNNALRANATIALYLISGYITPPSQRALVLLNFCRPMLRDAFEPSRVAALRSLYGVVDCLSAKQLAEGVLPAVASLTVDPSSEESRSAALALIRVAVSRLEENHKQLLEAQQPAAPADAAGPKLGSTPLATSVATGDGESTSSSWGWGFFKWLPPATTETSTAPSAATSVVGAASAANGAGGWKASPLPSTASTSPTNAVTVQPAPVVLTAMAAAAATAGGGSGWSDDDDNGGVLNSAGNGGKAKVANDDDWDDEDDGELVKPAASTATPAMKLHPLRQTSGMGVAPPARVPTAPLPASLRPSTLSAGAVPAGSASAFTTSLTPATSNASGMSTPAGSSGSPTCVMPSGAMKLRKKGGLGAARLD